MGIFRFSTVYSRAALAAALLALVAAAIPQPGQASLSAPEIASFPMSRDDGYLDAAATLAQRVDDDAAKLSLVPPRLWTASPVTSLDRSGDDELYETSRFQLRLRDSALYAQPLPVTSGLLADAGAVLSVALAREGSDLADLDVRALDPDSVVRVRGAAAIDSEASYDGVVTFTRVLVARGTGRVAVVRAFVPAADREAFAAVVLAALASASIEADGPIGPAYVPPAPPPAAEPGPEAAVAAAVPDPVSTERARIIERAAAMLGTPYVWGGNVAGRGMDCSAYISAAWGVGRYTTDSIGNVAVAITKEQLLPGDALNLETWRDPTRRGHIRLFDAWANAERTLVWVYEETPPRAIHRVIAYDPAYRPIRLAWLGGGGVAPLVPAPAAMPVPRLSAPAATPRPPRATPRPTVRPTPRPTVRPTARPSVRPTVRPSPSASAKATPRPTVRPSATVRPATATASPRQAVVQATPTPRRTSAPKRR